MDPKHIVILAFQLSIVCTVLGFGLHATKLDLLYLWHRPKLLLRSIFAVMIVMPIVAVLIERLFDFRPTTELALVALALSPLPPLLPGRMDRAGGEHAYTVALLVTLSLLAIVAIPLSGALLGWLFDRQFQVSMGAIARTVLILIVAPLVIGVFIRRRMPALAARLSPIVRRVANILLPLSVVVFLAAAWRGIWAAVGDGTIFAIALFVGIGLAVGHWFGRPERGHSIVLALASACRHPAIALTIASANFPDLHFGGTILLYVLVSALVGMPYVLWQRRAECPPTPKL
ncbi:Sodium dependent transporter [Lysobacter dokdonensis DS-58]|uniref:Sodium dependent transporter n=1 Tax=Lysobacter dokdonensis DS-58 TaxID=1300345 RepID=A0A0A2WL24_9GAMM|nr:bile acid:sodium symporter [Lysobacter dokdonensis]KGQ19427.1 Sodium dependent transporter [Lysobacter dokdonensis DS-58]